MAVNRIRGAFAVPRKGETFELRAGLVYVRIAAVVDALILPIGHSMRTNGRQLIVSIACA